jgi:2-desacetyl-2-hydroxyethyl bacteriochlorophyllide A dehydrogenase
MNSTRRRVVQFPEPGRVEVFEEPMRPPESNEIRVRTSVSAISPGTERLVYRGQVPTALSADPSIQSLDGGLSFPIRYGYSAVGRVEATGSDVDDSWVGRRVFSFQPHVSHFLCSLDQVTPLPEDVRDEDAVLIPNVETAVTLAMDGRPMIGERVVIFGQGVVGLLTTALVSKYPLEQLLTVDPVEDRRRRSTGWGADRSVDPAEGLGPLHDALGIDTEEATDAQAQQYEGADLVFELSGNSSVLNDAIAATGFDGRIVVGSWYGSNDVPIDFGGRFHRSRMQVTSSQVSSISPRLRGRWNKERRMQTVLNFVESLSPGDLVTHEFDREEANRAYEMLDQKADAVLQPLIRHE